MKGGRKVKEYQNLIGKIIIAAAIIAAAFILANAIESAEASAGRDRKSTRLNSSHP